MTSYYNQMVSSLPSSKDLISPSVTEAIKSIQYSMKEIKTYTSSLTSTLKIVQQMCAPYSELQNTLAQFVRNAYTISIPPISTPSLKSIGHIELSDEIEDVKETDDIILSAVQNPDNYGEFTDTDSSEKHIVVVPASVQLMEYVKKNPQHLYDIHWTEFEDFMAEFYTQFGFQATVTKRTGDGGKDIILTKHDPLGDYLYYVECKQYSADHPVGIGIIYQMAGVMNYSDATGAYIATTSFFTKPGRKFIADSGLDYRIQLHDFDFIKNHLQR